MSDFEQAKKMIDGWIEEREENAVINIVLFLKKHYKCKFTADAELNASFERQLTILYNAFCEDEDYPMYWSLEAIMNYMKKIEHNEESAILHYGIIKIKELVDKYC